MRLCLPTLDGRGLGARISHHFGSAPYLTLIDSDTGNVEVVPGSQRPHAPGACHAAGDLSRHAVEAVVCRGLGRRAFSRLQKMGLAVFVTTEDEASAALEAFRAGRLSPLSAEGACGGGRRHGCSS